MEYVFGTKEEMEILKVKGGSHTDLSGYHQTERIYPDQTITDSYHIVRKLDSQEDAEGNCYDWYEIDHHYRIADKTGPLAQQAAENAAATEDAICELDAGFEERIGAVETALCELDEIMSMGGETA